MDAITNDYSPAYIFFTGSERILKSTRRIRQGETIVHLKGPPLTRPDKYSIQIAHGVHIDCQYSLAGYINHSCKPNAAVRGTRIVAWECIPAGEQITIDYRKTERFPLAEPFACACGHCNGETLNIV